MFGQLQLLSGESTSFQGKKLSLSFIIRHLFQYITHHNPVNNKLRLTKMTCCPEHQTRRKDFERFLSWHVQVLGGRSSVGRPGMNECSLGGPRQ